MKILNYKYIQHRITRRPWGVECQFTVEKSGKHFDDIIMLRDGKENEERIAQLITERLKIIDHPVVIEEREVFLSKKEIESVLREKGYLEEGQTLDDLPLKSVDRVRALITATKKILLRSGRTLSKWLP